MCTLHTIKTIERRKLGRLVEQHPALPPPRQGDAEIVSDEIPCRHSEDVVEFLPVYCKLLAETFTEYT